MPADSTPAAKPTATPTPTPTPTAPQFSGRPADSIRAALLIAASIAAVWIAGQAAGAPPALIWAGALVVSTVSCWATGALPEPTATLLFFLCAVVLHIAPAPVVFSGFTSTAWWLMFGGAVTGVALRGTGLALRLADIIFHKRVNTYPQVIATVAMSAVGLAFLMPSTTGRVLLLMPIVLALSDRLGFRPGSNGRIGMVLTVAAASYMPPTSILPANIPNSVLLGAANSLYGINLSYGSYLLLHFPVLGALKTVVLVWLVCKLFPETAAMTPQPPAARTPMSKPETLLALLLALAVAAFATDAWHGISPAWISLAACIVCLLPGIGLVSPKALTEQVHLVPLLYVAGFLGLGAVVEHTGLGTAISAALLHWLPLAPGHTAGNVGALGAMGAVLGLMSTLPALPAVMTPLARDLATATGLPLETVLMLQVPVFSTVFFPYQSPPIVIAMQLGGVGLRHGTRLCLALAAITVVVLLPLDYLWWRLLGYLP
ncbi:Sodium:sulfate symporter transmembrane region [compost metagenome]|uniref:Anion permease n=1 Tax=Cupriavidus campinensis TaxID=151783 RepID=A0AAE9L3S1_9BURK|nr:SLC13 family permease [Cupriavidus campinensis]TSP09527.1 SLC13 family permease [Cupriavidus campinensis]URF07377.1 anion permease [Cupriavidus campinensis]